MAERLTAGSLCTGIGGLDLAVEQHFGAELIWYSEVEKAPLTVLEREWPSVPNLGDLTKINWRDVPPVDVLTAGYPCQPFSHAGKRKGTKDDRHLWPYIAKAVRVLRPRWLVLENVRGHLSLGFDVVLSDLAKAGFDAEWCVIRASDVGAPHQRARVFVVATRRSLNRFDAVASRSDDAPSDSDRESTGRDGGTAPRPQEPDARRGAAHLGHGPSDGAVPAADASDLGHQRPRIARGRRAGSADSGDTAPDPDGKRHEGSLPESWGDDLGSDSGPETAADPESAERGSPELEGVAEAAGRAPEPGERASEGPDGGAVAWGVYELAIRRWERLLGRPAPHPTDERGRLSPAFVEWMMGYPEGWVDGLSRTQALKALGNAVVSQQALAALAELAPRSWLLWRSWDVRLERPPAVADHPAEWSPEILAVISDLVPLYQRVLDPLAGTGWRLERALPGRKLYGVELEPEWARGASWIVQGNAKKLPFPDESFPWAVTSPVYGNRMSDHHNAQERCKACKGEGVVADAKCPKCEGRGKRSYKRLTYTHRLGRPLHPDNTGKLGWLGKEGEKYRADHEAIWAEVYRVLEPGGTFLLNIKNHFRTVKKGKPPEEMPVAEWHVGALTALGFSLEEDIRVATRGMGLGANRDVRAEYEHLLVFRKG